MISFKKIVLFLFLFMIGFTIIACQDTTSTTLTLTTGGTDSSMTTDQTLSLFDRISVVTESPTENQLLEIGIYQPEGADTLKDSYNPYDYNEISVRMYFTSPSGETYSQLAFWYREYEELAVIGEQIDENGFYTAGQELVKWGDDSFYHYMIRITPDEAGTWDYQMVVTVDDAAVQSMSGSFSVASSTEEDSGYIHVDETNQLSFVYDSGETFVPSGLNLAWWSTTLTSHDYDNWFHSLSDNNGNYARIWLSNWSFSLHKDSYSDFDTRQSVMIRLDHVLDVADQYGIYIMLTLLNHGQFSSSVNPEWSENVYNVDNGGMLEYPIQFFYNDEAIEAYKNELLYIIARWGYSENIFAWELFNEVDWIDGYSSLVVARWHDEMATFLHENDPYNHMVTTSYKYTYGNVAYAYDSIDFGAVHSYAYGDTVYYTKMISEIASLQSQYNKPIFFGEIGIDWESGSNTYHSDYTGVTIRQGLWGGIMLSTAGAAQWWWDSWIDLYDLWGCFEGASTYAKQIDLAGKQFEQLASLSTVTISDTNVGILGYLLSDEIYGYVYQKNWSYWNRTPDATEGVTIQIPMDNGIYTLEIYDTLTGEIVSTTTVEITNYVFSMDNVTVTQDFAFILKK